MNKENKAEKKVGMEGKKSPPTHTHLLLIKRDSRENRDFFPIDLSLC